MDRSRPLFLSDPLCFPSARFHCLIWVKWWGNGGRMRESERGGLFFWEQSVGEVFCLQLFAFVAWLVAGYSNVSLATSESLLSSWWSGDLVATSRSLSNTYSRTLSTSLLNIGVTDKYSMKKQAEYIIVFIKKLKLEHWSLQAVWVWRILTICWMW